ncbi:MAG: PAS domain-containing protein [Bacteroidales bacterium]|nr:PAS domain-containing protein [Bacteroidales bacterium]
MSEFTNNKTERLAKLKELAILILKTGNAHSFITSNRDFIETVVPSDFITLFDEIIQEGYDMEDIKTLTNKILNIFHITISNYRRVKPEPNSFLGVLEQNNEEMKQVLNKIRPVFKSFMKDNQNTKLRTELLSLFDTLNLFVKHYTIKENVLFPIIENTWPDYRCLQIMWSFHDDIRRNIKTVLSNLQETEFDIKQFNRCVGDIFFNMLAIKFREEQILFPYILSTISKEQLNKMNHDGFEIGYPYIKPPQTSLSTKETMQKEGFVNLGTGQLSFEQVKLIFNHLPVDITFVDENNKVCYFSTPKKRIFPRTTAILGREVNNCHPPESVHVVEKIVQSFKSGEKDSAQFWIKMGFEFILIQYFAVSNQLGEYKGVIEVSQEISDIRSLKGEKRLLDWD